MFKFMSSQKLDPAMTGKKILLIPLLALVFIFSGCIQTTEEIKPANVGSSVPGNQYNWSTMKDGPFNDKISYATSPDLINWEDSRNVLAEHASVPEAIHFKDKIWVYFVDFSEDDVPEKIGIKTSEDKGLSWSDKTFANFGDIGNIVPVDPDPFVTDDEKIRMYYFDIEEERSSGARPGSTGTSNKIYSAISEDGINFTQEEGIRFEKTGIFDPDVIKASDGKYYMYVGDNMGMNVIVAESNDGLTFTEVGIAYAGGAIPNVIEKDGDYYLFVGGIDEFKSSDPTSFSESIGHFQSTLGQITADPGVVQIDNDLYFMTYKYQEGSPAFEDSSNPPPPPPPEDSPAL